MKDHMAKLADIVKLDQEIIALREELEEIPSKVREVETQLSQLESDYTQKKTELDKVEAELKKLSTDLEDGAARLKAREEKLNTIKTQKEYQAGLKEVAVNRSAHKEWDQKIKVLTQNSEVLKQNLAPVEQLRNELHGKIEAEKSAISGNLNTLSAQLKERETHFNEQLLSLPEDIRHKYRRIGEKRQPAAAKVVLGTCQECFMSLPPQLFIEIQKTQEIHSCPNCHRLLFLDFD